MNSNKMVILKLDDFFARIIKLVLIIATFFFGLLLWTNISYLTEGKTFEAIINFILTVFITGFMYVVGKFQAADMARMLIVDFESNKISISNYKKLMKTDKNLEDIREVKVVLYK